MQPDNYHKQILRALGQSGESSYNELFKKIRMPKKTFQKKLYELVDAKRIKRDPPLSSVKTKKYKPGGKPIKFKLTALGETTIDVQDFCLKIEERYNDFYEGIVNESLQRGEATPLTGATLFITSPNAPICTIAHLPNKEQSEKLKPKLQNEATQQELGIQINRVIQAYIDSEDHVSEGQYGAFYLPTKQIVSYMGFLPNSQTKKIRELVDAGLFENEKTTTQSMFAMAFFSMFDSIYNKLKTSQKFREGKEGVVLSGGYRYNPNSKIIEPLAQSKT